MHSSHLAVCAVAIVGALGFVALTDTSAVLFLAVLACPIAMIVGMKVLMTRHPDHDRAPGTRSDGPGAASSSR